MKGLKRNRWLSVLVLLTMALSVFLVRPNIASADVAADVYQQLNTACKNGKYSGSSAETMKDHAIKQYKVSGGGYLLYTEITGVSSAGNEEFFSESQFAKLTGGAKQDFLKDMLSIANAMVADTDKGSTNSENSGVTTETVNDMLRVVQNKAGMGSQLLATLMSETKPDYATANRIYAPFSGVIGTCLALLAILIMSALGLTMALDIAYILIPPVQVLFGGAEDAKEGKGKGISGFISNEARCAVKEAVGKEGNGGSTEYKAAIGIYLKHRVLGLVILGICLLYLVQGQIYGLVAWFIDLFSGTIGF